METFGIYYLATTKAKLFCDIEDELVSSYDTREEAQLELADVSRTGELDELHCGYGIRKINQ